MDIRVLGSNVGVGSNLTEYVEEHLNRHVKKYFSNAVNADVYFSKQRNSFHVNIIVNEGVSNRIAKIKGEADSSSIYTCFNSATKKVAKQLRRHKNKIKRN